MRYRIVQGKSALSIVALTDSAAWPSRLCGVGKTLCKPHIHTLELWMILILGNCRLVDERHLTVTSLRGLPNSDCSKFFQLETSRIKPSE